MKAEMDKQAGEHQASCAEATVKHSMELKDLGKRRTGSVSGAPCNLVSPRINQSVCQSHTEVSYSQKLIVEYERNQDLQHESQRMQEEYEKQLRAAEESKIQSLEQLTQLSEAKLQEKTQLLGQVGQSFRDQMVSYGVEGKFLSPLWFFSHFLFVQCQEDAQQQVREFKEMMRQVEEDEESKIHDIQIHYEQKLHTEKETNTNLKGETGVMTQKVAAVPVVCFLLHLSKSPSHLCFFLLFGGRWCDHSSTVCRDRSMTGAQI